MELEEKIVRKVCAMWETGLDGVIKSYVDHHHPDFVWWNCARGTVTGRDICIQGVKMMHQMNGFASIKVPIRSLVVKDKMVYIERSDDLYRADGSVIAKVPVFGVVGFKGDMIISWRDYCDDWMRDFRPEGASKALA